jgi:hypothetical protein
MSPAEFAGVVDGMEKVAGVHLQVTGYRKGVPVHSEHDPMKFNPEDLDSHERHRIITGHERHINEKQTARVAWDSDHKPLQDFEHKHVWDHAYQGTGDGTKLTRKHLHEFADHHEKAWPGYVEEMAHGAKQDDARLKKQKADWKAKGWKRHWSPEPRKKTWNHRTPVSDAEHKQHKALVDHTRALAKHPDLDHARLEYS